MVICDPAVVPKKILPKDKIAQDQDNRNSSMGQRLGTEKAHKQRERPQISILLNDVREEHYGFRRYVYGKGQQLATRKKKTAYEKPQYSRLL